MVIPLLVLACAPIDDARDPRPEPTMAPVAVRTRASLDLRGVHPSPDEIAGVETDPAAIDGLVDTFLADPRFESRVRDLWAEVYLTRTGPIYLTAGDFGVDDVAAFDASVGDEVLRILGRVAAEDRPWTEIVTADWTMADELLASIWPVEREAGEGWQVARYTDGRPSAGVLTANSFYWRYDSTASNGSRKRANAASRILLCNDYLTRPIEFDRNVNLLDQEAVLDALHTNDACVNCHQTLDPLAAYFFGFFWYTADNPQEAVRYYPEREPLWRTYVETPPAYYGEPGFNLTELGRQIAGDSRFAECAVEQAYELLLHRPATLADTDALARHREAFLAGGLTMRSLIRSVVADPRYRAGATDAEGYVPSKMKTPDLLATSVAELTGYTWTYQDYDLLRTDTVGYRTLAGGADGYRVTANARAPNATLLLVQERLAESAAEHAVLEAPEGLFPGLTFTETPDTDREAVIATIQGLHLALFGDRVAADGEEVTAALELWADLYAVERDVPATWAGLLSVLLRDPDFLLY